MAESTKLSREINFLGRVLGEVILEQAGRAAYEQEEAIRLAARARRAGEAGAEDRLAALIRGLDDAGAAMVTRAFTLFFDLANLAEDRERLRVLRERERAREPEPRPESMVDAARVVRAAGLGAGEVRELLSRLHLELVLTAHPTEARRRSVRGRLRRIRSCLAALDDPELTARERDRWISEISAVLTALWQTDLMRPRRPTVLEEVDVGLYFGGTFLEVAPEVEHDLTRALEQEYPGERFPFPPIITLGSWIGGDRDGNPAVTAGVTREALECMRKAAAEAHLRRCRLALEELTPSARQAPVSDALRAALDRAAADNPVLARRLAPISPNELYRRFLRVVEWRLECTRDAGRLDRVPEGAYARGAELAADLRLMAESLEAGGGRRILGGTLTSWIRQVEAFGLHFARLDIRQESGWNARALGEILRCAGLAPDYPGLAEHARQELLRRTMGWSGAVERSALGPDAREACGLFELLAAAAGAFGAESLGNYVISMTHELSDVLAVLWMSRARELTSRAGAGDLAIPIVPLFETIHDLAAAPSILASMLDDAQYRAHLEALGGTQTVMIGYSDSTKDGGYLAACWALYRGQRDMYREAASRGVRLLYFHGRGGSLGRGGGPAARSILSLPPETLQAGIRMTEQGEVLADRYDDPRIAYRHLEQVSWATIVEAVRPLAPPREEWLEAMDDLASRAHAAYRELVEEPGFMRFFEQATPIQLIESLPIASRPSRRHGERTLADLRAIPWVFAWTQARYLLPAWYGIGTAFTAFRGRELLREMYRDWPFFQATLDNAVLALAKADMPVARQYAELVEGEALRMRIWCRVEAEFEASREAALAISGRARLLDETPWLASSIKVRNPNTDPLNLVQVEWMRRLARAEEAGDEPRAERCREILRLTVEGVAAGMRGTG